MPHIQIYAFVPFSSPSHLTSKHPTQPRSLAPPLRSVNLLSRHRRRHLQRLPERILFHWRQLDGAHSRLSSLRHRQDHPGWRRNIVQ